MERFTYAGIEADLRWADQVGSLFWFFRMVSAFSPVFHESDTLVPGGNCSKKSDFSTSMITKS